MFDRNASTKLYNTLMGNPNANNAIGRTSGRIAASGPSNDNFFTKRASSIGNAVGTTLSAPVSLARDIGENIATQNFLENSKSRMNNIAKKYGYNDYHDVWDARDRAEAEGDQATLDLIDNTINPELQAQANANANEATAKAKGYEDYRKNNLISQNINQDRGKFAGSAINTLSTMADVLLPGAGVAFNSVQGGLEGVADELEQNGLENFDWGRAGQNALVGAATGGVVGALNKGLSNSLAKNGGNLFKGGNAVTRGLNDLGSKTALGRVGSTIATGAGRGALSGAVGGATGAGLSAALNNQDVLGSALQGAAQGAQQGAFTGATMAGANMAISRTPGAGKFMQDVNRAQEDWRNSGSNFDERLTNTLTSGDSAVGEWLQGNRQSKVLGAVGSLGNRIQDVSDTYRTVDPLGNRREYTPDQVRQLIDEYENYKAPDVLSGNSSDEVTDAMGEAGVTLSEIFRNRNGGQFDPYSRADGEAFNEWVQQTKADLGAPNTDIQGPTPQAQLSNARRLDATNSKAVMDYLDEDAKGIPQTAPAYRAGKAFDDAVSDLRSNYNDAELAEMLRNTNNSKIRSVIQGALKTSNTPTTAAGWLKKAGERIVEDVNNRGVGLSLKDVSGQGNRLAMAGAGGGEVEPTNTELGQIRSSSIIKGGAPDGGDLVKADYVLPKNAAKRTITKAIKDAISSRFQGNSYRIGDTGEEAIVNARTKSEMAYQQPNMSDSDFGRKGSMAGNLDELLENVRDARIVQNKKPDVKPNVDYYISGRVPVDLGDGEVYYPRVDVEVSGGKPVAYNIADIKKYPGATPQGVPSGGDQPAVDYRGTHGRETIIPQSDQNVNPETEVYRTLTSESEPLRTSKEYEYRQKRNQKLLDQYGTIDKPTAKAVRAVETVGAIADAGFEKPADVEAVIKKITGSDGAANKLNRKVIANAGQINTMDGVDNGTSLTDFVDQQIRMNGLYGTNDGNALSTEIEAVLNQLPSRRDGTITGLDSAEDAFDVVQMLEKHAANYKGRSGSNYATSNPYKEQKAAVIDSVATLLKDRIYDASDVSQVVTPDVIADMKSWYPKNEKWTKWVDQNIATAKTGADLRTAQAPFVRMGRLIDNAIVNSGTFGSKVPRQLLRIATSNPLGVLINGAEMAAETPIGNRASAWVYDKLADRAARREASAPTPTPTPAAGEPAPAPTPTTNTAPATTNPSTQLYNAIGRTEGLTNAEQARTANYLTDAVQEAEVVPKTGTLDELISPTAGSSATSVYNSVYGTGNTQTASTGYFQPTGDYWTDTLATAMSKAIDADDVTAFASLYGMYQDALSNTQKQSSTTQKLSATQQRANAAMNSLERLSNMTPDLAYNLSDIPLVGGIATLGGNDYESEAKSLAQQIGYMVSGSNIKDSEAEAIGKSYVPQPWDNEQVRQNKLRRAYEIISQYQNGYAE